MIEPVHESERAIADVRGLHHAWIRHRHRTVWASNWVRKLVSPVMRSYLAGVSKAIKQWRGGFPDHLVFTAIVGDHADVAGAFLSKALRAAVMTAYPRLLAGQARMLWSHLSDDAKLRMAKRLGAWQASRAHRRESQAVSDRSLETSGGLSIDFTGLVEQFLLEMGQEESARLLASPKGRALLGAPAAMLKRKQKRMSKELAAAIAEDAAPARVASTLRKIARSASSAVDGIVETAIQLTAFDSEEMLLRLAPDAKYVQRSAVMDGRTCPYCAARNGKVYRVNDPRRPPLPSHDNCRCIYLPQETAKPTDKPPDYGEWFAEQPDDVQRQILGVGRFAKYKAGRLNVKRFINRRAKQIELSQL